MLGTKWVAPGEGATVKEFVKKLQAIEDGLSAWEMHRAASHLIKLNYDDPGSYGHRTNLALTGEPLTDYDMRRIAVCK